MTSEKLKYPLFLMRVSLFFVLLIGTLIKLIHPDVVINVISYVSLFHISNMTGVMVLSFFELIVLFSFLLGFKKKITYGLVLVMNILSFISILTIFLDILYPTYFILLYIIPMIAGSYVLYVLRDYDSVFTID